MAMSGNGQRIARYLHVHPIYRNVNYVYIQILRKKVRT